MYNKNDLVNYIEDFIEKDEVCNTLMLALKHKYYNVYKHCLNVCFSSYLLSHNMNLPEKRCISIALGGLFHDIGKINIPSKVLYKIEALNTQECSIIRRHPITGVNILSNSKYISNIENCILYHHERYDGTGYCNNLKGTNIPLEGRIICICDSFDAMISYRSYKKSLSLNEAKEELIRNKNTQFDGNIVDLFLEIVDDFYNKYYNAETPIYINNFIKEKDNSDISIKWENILDNLPDIGVLLIDKFDKVKFCNKFAGVIRNKKREDIVGKDFLDFHKKHRKNIIRHKLSKVKSGEIYGWERIMKRDSIYLENKYIAIQDDNKNYQGLLMMTRDVTEQEKILRLLEKSIENLNILVQANNLLTEVYNLNEVLDKARELFDKIINIEYINIIVKKYDDIEAYNVNIMDGFSKEIIEYVNNNIQAIFSSKDENIEFKTFDNSLLISIPLVFNNEHIAIIFIQTNMINTIGESEEKLLRVIGNYTNSAIQKHLLFTEIEDRAIKDNLTGIYNRQYLQKIINSLNDNSKKLGIIVADVDNLKYINDNFGHIFGDLVIKTTADILKNSIRKIDYIFRYGGDEFIALILDCNEKIIRTILKNIEKNTTMARKNMRGNINLSVSIGYSIAAKDVPINEGIKKADENMYMQKRRFKEMILN